ncbi:MAG: dihydrofolate reductase [Bacteroidales bacterium]|nr:dihydrofolate reductase [Bacteroidales bacterium]MBQ2108822.1 dihydrofolate reductase [Bacteroidales bacterium]MBQ2525735.1 dihydrofolate reductase [Bacteroidales bacterium]MBQ5528072.1 dihydrofolate reductase [Bacteroidales bacterium]
MLATIASVAAICSCGQKQPEAFRYTVDEFADLKIMRYQIPGWNELSLRQKAYAYHLSEAAKYGRDITWDQYCAWNLPVRHLLENILENYKGDRKSDDWKNFEIYAKRVFFSNGVHHHYAEDKFVPSCDKTYFSSLMESVGEDNAELLDFIYDKDALYQRRSTSKTGDIVALSAVNFYDNVTREEVDAFYGKMIDPKDPEPISYGLNSKLMKDSDGVIREHKWMVGGIYGPAIEKICEELLKAKEYAENDIQKRAIDLLVEYYHTGDLRTWDAFNVEWVKDTLGQVDFINGFIEDYDDPLGRKATWEGCVQIKDSAASARTGLLSANAQWFEDNSPVDPRFRKKNVKGISARVVNTVVLAGAQYPATPIGINLPNADWIRKEHGSKSVTIANITHTYDYSAAESPKSVLNEFAWSEEEIAADKKYSSYADEVHTDLHECLGHASGQLLPGTSSTALGEYQSALEEARADLFGLYYIADPKLVELGIMPDSEAYKAHYTSYIRNGLFTQFTRVELGRPNTEAHMQNRKLIAEWCFEKGADKNVIEKKVRDGKTYFVVNDFEALRGLFAELLAEIQRIKSEGDYEAGKALIETYAVDIDPDLHKEVLERYQALNLKPYGGFINPEIVPVENEAGEIVDYKVEYASDFLQQQLDYAHKYSTL